MHRPYPARFFSLFARWSALLGALAIVALYGPSAMRYARDTSAATIHATDVCQHVAPYLDAFRSLTRSEDYVGNYLRACHPIGYRALFTVAASAVDPRPFSKILSGILFAVFIALMAACARPFGGWPASVFVVASALSASVFLERIQGGLVRSFAFPLAAALVYGVLSGRVRWIIGASVAAAAFYQTLAVTGGLFLAALLLVMPAHLRGDAATWDLRRRVIITALVALTMGLLIFPTMYASRDFGPLLTREAMAQYPEAGEEGRNGKRDGVGGTESVLAASRQHAMQAFAAEKPWLHFPRSVRLISHPASAALALLGLAAGVVRRRPAALRLALALCIITATYQLAVALSPLLYLPERYTLFTLPIIALVAIPIGIDALIGRPEGGPRAGQAVALLGALTISLAVQGGPVQSLRALRGTPDMFPAISRLPPDACIAGWPTACDYIPYLSERRVLLSYKTHLTYHRAYVDEMRVRMAAVIAAFCATNNQPIAELHTRFGVTHLFVQKSDLALPPPRYFKPFDSWMADARGTIPQENLALWQLLDRAAVWSDGSSYLLDLSLVPSTVE